MARVAALAIGAAALVRTAAHRGSKMLVRTDAGSPYAWAVADSALRAERQGEDALGLPALAQHLLALATAEPEDWHDEIASGRLFWYLTALVEAHALLNSPVQGDHRSVSPSAHLFHLWPRAEERELMARAVQAADAREAALAKMLREFFAELGKPLSHAGDADEALRASFATAPLGSSAAFVAPDYIVVLGCVDRDETDDRVAKAVAYARLLERAGGQRPVFVASGRGFWMRAAAEAREGCSDDCVNPAFHYDDWAAHGFDDAPSEAAYIAAGLQRAFGDAEVVQNADALDTVGNALFDMLALRKAGKDVGEKKVVLVTSDYHALRAFSFYERVFPSTVELAVAAAPSVRVHALGELAARKLAQLGVTDAAVLDNARACVGDGDAAAVVQALVREGRLAASPVPEGRARDLVNGLCERDIKIVVDVEDQNLQDKNLESKERWIRNDQTKVTTSLETVFSLTDPYTAQTAFVPRGAPLDVLFQLFKPKGQHGHDLYNGMYARGPVDFMKTSPETLIKEYLQNYADQLGE